jgi:hypothetical protein
MRAFNLAIRFILELCGLAAAAYWGFTTFGGFEWLFGLGAPILVGLAWGTLVAPKAKVQLPYFGKLALGVVILGLCGAALVHAGQATIGLAYIGVVVLNALATAVWGQPLDGREAEADARSTSGGIERGANGQGSR